LVAYDKTGHRLGYGAGYYDRTVSIMRAERQILTVGVGYDEQEIDAVPAGAHDQKMDGLITDKRVIWFNSDAKARAK
jgi:5-formyltetrahydrofolate cyclo-ligase